MNRNGNLWKNRLAEDLSEEQSMLGDRNELRMFNGDGLEERKSRMNSRFLV